MRHSRFRSLFIALSVGVSLIAQLLGIASNVRAEMVALTASLDGGQEVPPVTTDGTGDATLSYDTATNDLTWTITFSGLLGVATGAHFHGPAAEGSEASVQVDIGGPSGLTSPMVGTTTLTGQQADQLLDGLWYINIHTGANPGGEIRGQVQPVDPQLTNISTRGVVGTGDEVMIGGFIIEGSTPKTVLVRARGPVLTDFGVPGVLANPFLQLFDINGTEIANNDDWETTTALCQNSGLNCGGAAEITATELEPCRPIPLPGQPPTPTGCSSESAILVTLDPGNYTAQVSGVPVNAASQGDGETGVGLIEVFEIGTTSTSRLTNISTRGLVGAGDDVMIGGLIIGGTDPMTVLIRARGPVLADFGVPGVLANPFLQLFDGNGTEIADNDDWETTTALCQNSGLNCGGAAEITATELEPCRPIPLPGQPPVPTGCSLESALLVTLNPGNYTAQVSGGTGVGLVEVFEVVEAPLVFPPVLDPIGNQTVAVGSTLSLNLTATDPEGDPLTFSVAPLPANTSLNAATGAFTFTPVAGQVGDIVLTFTVSDGVLTDSETISITVTTVNAAPTLNPIGDQTVALGESLALTLTATDPDGDPLSFSVSPVPLPTNASLDSQTGVFTFAPAANQVGTFDLAFAVTDGMLSDSETVAITVEGAPPGGVTALSGRLLDSIDFSQNVETPVVGATVSLLGTGISVTSDATGRFLLTGLPAGSQVLDIDTSTANAASDGSSFAGFREAIELIQGVTNVVDRPFFLPRIAGESLTTVDPGTTTVVTNPTLGVTLTIPPNTAKNPDGTNFTGQLSISVVPPELAPVALPEELKFGLLITIQPVGMIFDTPIPITFPNIDNLPPGSETNIWSLDPKTGTFVIVGTGRVSADGSVVETISGGIQTASWHAILSPAVTGDPSGNNNDNQDQKKCCDLPTGSRTAVSSGNLTVEHTLTSYRFLGQSRALRLVYNSLRADPQPVISSGTTISVRAAVPPTVSTRLSVAGVDQGLEVFMDTSGLSENIDETIRLVAQFDASALETGLYPYRLTQTSNYAQSAVSSVLTGNVLVHNQRNSPFGAGWTLEGLTRLHVQEDGSLLLTEGDGSAKVFVEAFTALLEDTFDTENGGFGTLNYAGFANWDVTDGTVDLIGNGFFDLFPGNGLYVDLDGTSNDAARLALKITFTLDPGDYELEFDLAGSQRGDVNTVTVTLGGVFSEAFTRESNAPLTTITRSIQVSAPTTGKLSFDHAGGDNFGLLLDDVKLKRKGDGGNFQSPLGDFSTLVKNADGTFTRTLKNGTQINFNANGLQTSVADRNGNTTTYTYDPEDRLNAITDPVGLVTTLTYTGDLLASITDPAARTSTFEHDANGNLTRITDPDGTIRRFFYDARHRLIAQTSKRGFVTRYEYNFAGRNVKSTLPDSSTRQVNPSEIFGLVDLASGLGTQGNPAPVVRPEGVTATFTDGNGNVTTFATDRFGAATETTDPLGRQLVITRDDDGNPTQIVNPNGAITTMTYDDRGNVLTIQEAQGQPEERQTTSEFEATFNQVTQITDPAGKVTTFEYDAQGNLIKSTNPLGVVSTFTSDSRGLLLSSTDENGNATTFAYDTNGNLETVTNALANVIKLTRDAAGNITAMTEGVGSPEERTSTLTYDAFNQLLRSIDGTGATTQFRYDAAGNVAEIENATGQITAFAYDERNRVTRMTDPLSGITQFTYDLNGNLIRSVDGLGNTRTREYDAANQLVKSTDALAGEQVFAYNTQGKVVSFQDARGQTATFAYDLLNRQIQKTNPLSLITTFTYDSRGNLITGTDPKGQVITNVYDDLSRLIRSTTPDNTTSLTYDAVGNLLTVQDDDSSVAFSYDGRNRVVTAQTIDVGVQPAITLTNTYDAVGNRKQLADSEGGVNQFNYDAADRLAQLNTPAGDTINLSFDPAGRLRQILFPNGVVSDHQYDMQGRLASLTHTAGGSTVLASFGLTYNDVGNILAIVEQTQTRQFTYDALQRVTGGGTAAAPETYAYDAAGNRDTSNLSATHVHDASNRLLEDDDFTYTYDDNGNLATKTAKSNNAVTTYTWNAQNRLIQIDLPDGTMAMYRYDGLGRRIEKNVSGAITRYIYDGLDILLEYDGTNILLARYGHGNRIDQPLSMERGGQSFFYHADHLGSIRKLTDASGVAVNTYNYDSYGRLENIAEGIANPFTYTGRELDTESGLYYYRARYYDPQTGRFINKDPIGFLSGDSNRYAYAKGNPLSLIDPLGLDALGDLISFGSDVATVIGGLLTIAGVAAAGPEIALVGIGLVVLGPVYNGLNPASNGKLEREMDRLQTALDKLQRLRALNASDENQIQLLESRLDAVIACPDVNKARARDVQDILVQVGVYRQFQRRRMDEIDRTRRLLTERRTSLSNMFKQRGERPPPGLFRAIQDAL